MTEVKQTHVVATDALASLGTVLPAHTEHGRDAIHLAVDPVIAGEKLYAGDHIFLKGGEAFRGIITETIGIVDPFLRDALHVGDKFWLVVYPRTITSLRHVWEHPAFPPEGDRLRAMLKPGGFEEVPKDRKKPSVMAGVQDQMRALDAAAPTVDKSVHLVPMNLTPADRRTDAVDTATKEVKRIAREQGVTYEDLMEGADAWLMARGRGRPDEYRHVGDNMDAYVPDEFWPFYETIRGVEARPAHRESFFRCAC